VELIEEVEINSPMTKTGKNKPLGIGRDTAMAVNTYCMTSQNNTSNNKLSELALL